jgi:hypothetical protein
MRPRWALPKLKLQLLRILLRVRLELTHHRKMPKLMRRLDELRCEVVGFNAFEHLFCKRYFGPFEASHISCNVIRTRVA